MEFTRIRQLAASLRTIRWADIRPSQWIAACPLRRSLAEGGLTRRMSPRLRGWIAATPLGRLSWMSVRPWMPCVIAGGLILVMAVALAPQEPGGSAAMADSEMSPQRAGLVDPPPAVAGQPAPRVPETQPALAQAQPDPRTPDARSRFQERLAQRRAATQAATEHQRNPGATPPVTSPEQPGAQVPPHQPDALPPIDEDVPPSPEMLLEAERMQAASEDELERLREAARASVDPELVVDAQPVEPVDDAALPEGLEHQPPFEVAEHEVPPEAAEHEAPHEVVHEAPPPAEGEVVAEGMDPVQPQPAAPQPPIGSPQRPTARPGAPGARAATPQPPVPPQPGRPVQPGQPDDPVQPGQALGGIIPRDAATNTPDLKQPGWWVLPAEERPYFFTWNDVTLPKACQDLVEMSGLSMIGIGQIDQPSTQKKLSIQSVRLLNYDEALTLFNELIVDMGYWVARREQFLVIRPLTEWYRQIPPERMYMSVEAYRKAALPDWEVASVIYQPQKRSPEVLATLAIDSVPLNTARATLVPGTNQIELKGFVLFINRQLQYLDGGDFKADDGRYWVEYPLTFTPAADAAQLLTAMMPVAESSGAAPARPAVRLPPNHPMAAQAAAESPGTSTSDLVEIREDARARRLMVKASAVNHELAERYLKDYIDRRAEERDTELIPLQYADAHELAEIIRPLLGERQIVQVPVPQPQRPGQPAQPAAMQERQVTVTGAILTPVPAMKSILVKGNQDEMTQVKALIALVDQPRDEDQAKFQYVQLEHGNATGIAALLTQAFGVRTQRGAPGEQQFRAVADQQNDHGLVITGEPADLAHARELITRLDVDPEAGGVEHLVRLENTSPTALADILGNRYGSGGGRGAFRGGAQSGGLPRFIPDETSKTLIILAHNRMWPDIERLIKEIDENSTVQNRSKLYRLKHAQAASLANMLNQSFGGMRARRFDDSGPTFQFEQNANILLVTASDSMHERIAELVADLDQPGPGDETTFQPIELAHAEATYVAEKLQELLVQGFRPGRDQAGRVQARVVAEPVSNRVLVLASPEDFKQAETLARQIDEEYQTRQVERQTFVLENAMPSQVARVLQTMYPDSSGPRGASSPGGVRVVEAAASVVVMAPRDKMAQIESLVQELDADPAQTNEIRSYMVEGAGSEGTFTIARTLEQLFSSPGTSQRGGTGPGVRFIGDRGSELLFVSAPPARMAEIDAKVQEILKSQGSRDTTFAIRHFDVLRAQPEELAEMILPLLMVKYEELQQASGGRRSASSMPQIVPHRVARRVMVAAPEALMPLVGELIADFDQTPSASVTQMVMLKKAKASEIAPVISEMIERRSSGSSPRRVGWFRSGWRGGDSPSPSFSPSSGISSSEDLVVTAVESSNAILLRGPEVKVYEAQELIVELDENAMPAGPMIKVFQIKEANVYDVVSVIEEIVGGGSSSFDGGPRRAGGAGAAGGVIIKTDYNRRIIVSAPADKFPIIEQLIETKESLALAALETTGETGEKGTLVPGQNTRGEITKRYDISGPVEETAKHLDKILLSLLGWTEAPYVKSFPFARQIIVTGKPQYFKEVEEWLEKLEANPPPVQQVLMVRRVPPNMPPSRLLEQLQQQLPGIQMNIAALPGRHDGKKDPLALIKEITYDEPVVAPPPIQPAAVPFVPPNTLNELRSALSAVTLAQATVTTAPAEAAPPEESPASSEEPVAEEAPAAPTPAAPATVTPAAVAQPPSAESAPPRAAVPQTPAAAPSPAAPIQPFGGVDTSDRDRVQVRYNEETGEIYILGPASQVTDMQRLTDDLIERARELAREGLDQPIRVFRIEHVDVNVAAAILEQMFNAVPAAAARAAQQQAARAARRQQGQQGQQGQQPPGQPAAGQGQDDEDAARRRREDGREEREGEDAAPAAAGADQIRVFPDARTRTLVIRASEDLFVPIAELLLKIDRPGTGAPVDIKIFQLEKLNAYDVEQAIKAILKIDDGLRTAAFRRMPGARPGTPGMPGGIDAQSAMIEALQQQMLEMQATAMEAEGADGQPGRTMLNPAKEITITSDATTNSIIVRAPDDGMRLVEKLILELEEQEIPLQIKTIPLKHGEAEKVAAELEKIFGGSARRGPATAGGEGVTPSRMGEVRISADARTNTIVIRALEPDLERIEPIITELDVPMTDRQMQLYTVEHGSAPEMAATLSKIFVTDEKTAGSRAVRITADADTNTVLVWAPEPDQMIIGVRLRELDARVEQTVTPRQIQLDVANATSVATRLRSVFAPPGASGRGVRQRVTIEGDDNSGLLFVVAPNDEMFARIEATAKQLDTVSRQDIRVFKLEHASASDILASFKDMTAQLVQQMRGGPGGELFAATADQRMNALIVTGSPATFLAVETVLAQLDVAPSGTTAVTTGMFTLTTGNAPSVASTINSIYSRQAYIGGLKPPYAVAEATANLVYVYGTQGQIAEIKAQIIDPYEAVIGPAASEMKDYQIPIKYAKVEDVSTTLSNWFVQRRASLQGAGGPTIRPSELAVTIVPDPATRQLLVVCTENNKKLIDQLLAMMDKPEVAESARQARVFPLQFADPSHTAQAITTAFGRTGNVSESEQIKVVPEVGTSSVIVSANAENLKKIEEMIVSLDKGNVGRVLRPEPFKLEHARASEVAATLNTMISQTMRRDRSTGLYPVTVTANDATNTLLVAGPPQEFETVSELITTLDVPPSMDVERALKPYTLKYADVSSVVSAINTTFQTATSRNPRDSVQAVGESGTLSVIVSATPENHAKVKALIDDLDVPGTGTRATFPIDIAHAEPEDVAAALTEIYATSARDRRGRPAASFTVPRGASKLLVTCTESELPEIQALITELDVQTSSARDVQIVPVRHVTPTEMANLLTEFMRKPGRQGRADPSLLGDVKIAASTSASAVVLTGPADRLTELAELAAKIDAVAPEQAEHGRRVNVIALKNADPSSVATVINQSFARPGTVAEADRVTAVAEWTTGTVVVTATEAKMADVNKMIQDLDQELGNAPLQEIVSLDHARAEDLATVLMTTYRQGRRARQSDQPIAITAEPTSNTLLVSAGRADIEGIKAMIGQLDQPASENVEALRVVPLQFMDATETLTIMQEYLRKPGATARGGQSQLVGDIRLQASPTMNALIVSGRERDLDRVVDIVRNMDHEMPGAGTAPQIIPLENAMATQLAATLTRLFSDPAGRTRTRAATDVVPLIIADETSNSLVVRAKPLDYSLIADMAQKLDVESTGTSGIEVIPLHRGSDVKLLAQQIESTINKGESLQASQYPGTRPPQVAIGYDERAPCLFVSGSPELFPRVRQLVTELQGMRPMNPGTWSTAVIRPTNINPQEMKRVLDQMIHQQQRINNINSR